MRSERLLEQHSVEPIPAADRHGRPLSLLLLWFSLNASVLASATGLVGVSLGLSLRNTVVALVLGNAVGGLFMAYHSAQGPVLGLPQMIQSRAQFGYFGAALPNLFVLVMYFGYYVGATVLGGQALASLLHIGTVPGVFLGSALTWLVAVVGYRGIHSVNRVMAVVSVVLLVALLGRLLGHLHTTHAKATSNTAGTFMLVLAIAASWQITFAPYVSDYSRYLPASVSTARTFWYTYVGSLVGGITFMVLGAVAAISNLDRAGGDMVGFLSGQFPAVKGVITLLLFLGLAAGNAENLYGPYVTTLATVTRTGGRMPAPQSRALVTGALALAGALLGAAVSSNFIVNLTNFITFLLYLLVPWTAINLTDFYVVHRGRYDIDAILSRDGRYGLVNVRALVVYAVAALVEVPFMNSTVYEGPLAKALGGTDIAWIVGLAVAGSLWLAVARRPADAAVGPLDLTTSTRAVPAGVPTGSLR